MSSGRRVAAAMSGGVDSSVAAYILRREGYEVFGVSMQVWDYRNNGGSQSRATCCAPSDFMDARRSADQIGIPYYVFDFEESFRESVIKPFVETYEKGLTPNPCIDCNSKVKFKELRRRASGMGAWGVATGHYAQIKEIEGAPRLLRGRDPEKDQSYFLYGLKPEELASTLFPVGHLTKPEVREIAKAASLPTAEKPESQDICFVSGKASDFVAKIGGRKNKSGVIVDKAGKELGLHDGIHSFTVGQRRGIGVGGAESPLYVLELRPETQTVVVGEKAMLETEGFRVRELNLIDPELIKAGPGFEFKALAQLRHRHPGAPVTARILENGEIEAKFLETWSVVSPGQAAVFYDLDSNERVLGGGRIARSF